ncbi:hypothetical protein PSTT_09872 [Puccinia striiformis]|uniref:Uncharacterized protein n=1 Tax=Puccinia striiformis TaxID=27350 RepID=A0A2S4V6I1_9BASI|nr:hypothetical protein PSTT_09872 [Puccinia striiformis]
MQRTFNGEPKNKPSQPTSRVSAGLSSLAGGSNLTGRSYAQRAAQRAADTEATSSALYTPNIDLNKTIPRPKGKQRIAPIPGTAEHQSDGTLSRKDYRTDSYPHCREGSNTP